VQVSPVAGEIVAVSATVPVKPLTGATVMVDVPAAFASTVTVVGLAATVKSRILTVTTAECDRLELVPVTVTVYVPALPVHESVLVPEPVTLVGVRVHVRPVVGEILEDSETTPLKPFRAVIVIVEVAAVPAFDAIDVGLAAMVKS